MSVDKFGRNGDRTTIVYTGINIANLANSFLRRDGGNTSIGAIYMISNIFINVSDLLSNQDVTTKNCVETNAFTTAGGVVSDDIKLNVVPTCQGVWDVMILLQVRNAHFCWDRHKYASIFSTQFTITSAYQDNN